MPESLSISDKLELIYFGNHPQRRLILCQVPPDGVDGIAVCEVMDHGERDQTAQRLVDLWNGTTHARLATATELLREMRFCDVHFERTGNIVKCCAICKHYRDKHAPDCRLAAFLEGAKLADNPEAKA